MLLLHFNPKSLKQRLLSKQKRAPLNPPLLQQPSRKPSPLRIGVGLDCQSRVRPNSVNSAPSRNTKNLMQPASHSPSPSAHLLPQSKVRNHHPWRCNWRRLRVLSSRRPGQFCGSTSFCSFCDLPRAGLSPKVGQNPGIFASMAAAWKRPVCSSRSAMSSPCQSAR